MPRRLYVLLMGIHKFEHWAFDNFSVIAVMSYQDRQKDNPCLSILCLKVKIFIQGDIIHVSESR